MALQEAPRGDIGWTTTQSGKWQIVGYQNAVDWRGCGIAYDPDVWAIIRKIPSPHGCWLRLRKIDSQQDVWVGSTYVPPHYSTGDLQQAAQDHQAVLPATHLPVLLFGDTNAQLKWVPELDAATPYGEDSKGRALLDTLHHRGLRVVPPKEGQLHQPTSRPRKEGVVGKAIDWAAVKHTVCDRVQIMTDSCYHMGTDHDMLVVKFFMHCQTQTQRRIRTGKRVLRSKIPKIGKVDQEILKGLAARHTAAPTGQGYRDTTEVKKLFQAAKQSRAAADWKVALRARRQGHMEWKRERVQRAAQGDWAALRASRPKTNSGWEHNLATNLQTDDPHEALHQHYAGIFHKRRSCTQRSATPPSSPDITFEELQAAMAKGKLGKSVGHDEVSMELFREVVDQPEGAQAVLQWFNHILHSGDIPKDWHNVVMVLLPKTRMPKTVGETRPISMGCTAEKIFCHIVLTRCKPRMHLEREWQCAGEHRQSADYIHTIYKLLESEREWQCGLAILKVDFAKAFDSVVRDKLLSRMFDVLGDCEEYRIWENLMTDTYCTLLTTWSQTCFPTDVGIRQGAIESPYLFGLLVEWILCDITKHPEWRGHVSTYRDLSLTQTAYMDDLLMWDGDCRGVETRYRVLREGFSQWGLRINPAKCSLYVSPKHEGLPKVNLDGAQIQAQPTLPVMGIPFRVGANFSELLQPTWQKARDCFWSIKHVLCSSTPIGKRLRILDRVVGGVAMWNTSPIPPETGAMQGLNLLLYQCVIWMLKLRKPDTEHWTEFRQRGFRQARQLVQIHLPQRWSTKWLSQWWGYMGHLARMEQNNVPNCASMLCDFRPLKWWTHQQALTQGARHHGRYHAKIHPLEARMNRAAGGEWRQAAQDRRVWQQCAQSWIEQNDVPWASGHQFALEW